MLALTLVGDMSGQQAPDVILKMERSKFEVLLIAVDAAAAKGQSGADLTRAILEIQKDLKAVAQQMPSTFVKP